MNDNEAATAENPDSLTPPARKGVPLASAFDWAAAAKASGMTVPSVTMIRQVTEAMSARPRVAVSPQKVVVQRRQRSLTRSVAFRTRRRRIDHRLTCRDRAAASRARRPRPGELDILEAMRAALSAPITRVVENVAGNVMGNIIGIGNVMAPFEKLQRVISEMVRPSWLRAFEEMQETLQRLVRTPMLDALRRIQEQIAGYAWPGILAAQRTRDEASGRANWFMGAFRHTRDWASGFMTYQAKLRQQISSTVGSWNWKLPDFTEIVRPITDDIVSILRGVQWPGWSAVTETIVKLAVRAVFWAAVRVRNAIIHEENSEEIVREFMIKVLDRRPKGQLHVEAAKEALLEDTWLKAEPENVREVLRARIKELHRNHRLIGDTKLGHRHITSLQTPLGRAGDDSDMGLTLADALADPRFVEDLVLSLPEFRDPRIDRVLAKLKPGERKVADLYVVHDGMTWDLAAAAAGQPPAFGERVRRKLSRLGDDFESRQAGGLHVPTTTRPRTRPAFG